jgi:hypothetical protein
MYQLINQNYHCSLKECHTSCQTSQSNNHLIKENNICYVLPVTIGQKVTIKCYAHFCFQIIFILNFNYLKKMYGIKHFENLI